MKLKENKTSGRASFGTDRLSFIDHLGIWLSRRAIIKAIGMRSNLSILELGCGYSARNLMAILDRAGSSVGVDFNISDQVKDNS
jgi:ubiquinone/menaquinone biosynthesis C-methylase UbiE